MHLFYFKHRLRLWLNSRTGTMRYYKSLPIEIRCPLRYGIFHYNWKYPSCWYKNTREFIKDVRYCLSENYQINRDWWNLDSQISKFILPRLRLLKTKKNGYPMGLDKYNRNEKLDDGSKTWDLILDDMIFAFEWSYRNEKFFNGYPPDPSSPIKDWYDSIKERRDRGFAYFSEYYGNLWD